MVSIGIVGCGYWGAKHIRSLQDLGLDHLIACDADTERLANIRRRYASVETTTDFTRLLGPDVQGVIIATPMSTHFSLARSALLHGKDVLVEKPLTTDVQHAEELVEIAEQRRAVLMVGHTFVYNPAVDAVRELIESGELGDIYYLDSSRLNLGLFQHDASVLWDLAPHDLSMLVYLLGRNPSQVRAWGSAHVNRRLLDNAHIDLSFPGGTRAHIHVSWLEPIKVRRTTVVGTKKMVVYDDVAPTEKVWIYDKGITVGYHTDNFDDFHLSYRFGHTTILNTELSEPLQLEQKHFLECIHLRARPKSDGFAGLEVVELLSAIHQSIAEQGTAVSIGGPARHRDSELGSGSIAVNEFKRSRSEHRNGTVRDLLGERR